MNTDDHLVPRRQIDDDVLGPAETDLTSPHQLLGADLSEAITIGEALHSRRNNPPSTENDGGKITES